MIKVNKPKAVPKILMTRGISQTRADIKGYQANRRGYKFDFKTSIYNHSSVKKILKQAQHYKCCYCERNQKYQYGEVEHYRPKEGYRSKEKDKIKKPGYYWLAYDWNNLYFVCKACNIHKSYFFPLKDEKRRAKYYRLKVDIETPLIIDPGGRKNPRKHIFFNYHLPSHTSTFGKKTIDVCKLDRPELIEERQEFLKQIDERLLILKTRKNNHKNVVAVAEKFIENCLKPESPFFAAAYDYITKEIKRLKIKIK